MSQTAIIERAAGSMMKPIRVAVIGAGASGLVTAKYLRQARQYFGILDIEVRIFEREDGVGGVYKYKVYEEAEMVSSKYLTAFSDFRVPKDLPDFLPVEDYVRYLEGFCTQFDLWGIIETNTEIFRVSHTANGHRVFFRRSPGLEVAESQDGEESWDCDAIAVCSGLNNVPSISYIEGLENVKHLHSSEVKERTRFGLNTSVMILGVGETAMDLAHLAVTSEAREVVMCHKGGFFCAKKVVPLPVVMQVWKPDPHQKPVDTAIASFLDTAYLPERLQHSNLLWSVYDKTFKALHYLSGGTAAGPDQWVGEIEGERNNVDSLFLVKSDRALPYLNEGNRPRDIFSRIRAFVMNIELKNTSGRKILTAPWPLAFRDDGTVVFPDSKKREHVEALSRVIKPDLVVAATGYVRRFDFLDDGYPEPSELDVRGIWRRGEVTAGFIGFVRPGIGAIPPLAELQAQLWVLNLLRHKYPQQMALHAPDASQGMSNDDAIPHYEIDYALKARGGHDLFKSKHGVEQESYAYQLALDMGSAPTFSFMKRQGFKALFTWAMGSNFNTKFRLIGPWRWTKGALPIMRGELFDVVKQTGGGVFFTTYTLLPLLLFGSLTLLLHATAGILRLVGMKERANKMLGTGNIPRREGDDL
ncbi:dimethylaniline monooxygenase [Colletotrichum abscissum]|uniref:Dimethylaniline monooxygenase n=1 Tax=Colletotrichum abscissum TaxID=1671311 RepID=A0A9P9X459_9PEZI|nr:dimethylaniline monooxygenase [Colletotrichum abscissum]KAI3535416.1 dimethylaniline monooxygenase [Colletotrichum abscissum]KAK1471705.1 dimethylaniline monooxygenase [Colletotrichum abscissum]